MAYGDVRLRQEFDGLILQVKSQIFQKLYFLSVKNTFSVSGLISKVRDAFVAATATPAFLYA